MTAKRAKVGDILIGTKLYPIYEFTLRESREFDAYVRKAGYSETELVIKMLAKAVPDCPEEQLLDLTLFQSLEILAVVKKLQAEQFTQGEVKIQ